MRKSYRFKGDVSPARYLSGLDGELRQKRDDEIARRAKIAKRDPDAPILSEPLPGDSEAKPRRSKYTAAFKAEYGDITGFKDISKATGISADDLETVYARGVQAAKGSGHRPGVSKEQWGWARLYAFIMKLKHDMGVLNHDQDVGEKYERSDDKTGRDRT